MPFFQVVDELTSNPKFQRLLDAMGGDVEGAAAVGLWTAAGSKTQQALGDGVISMKTCVSMLLNPQIVQALAARLVQEGLWHEPGHSCPRCAQPPAGSWVFHDWFDLRYETGAQIKITRGKRAELKDRKVTTAVWARDRVGHVLPGGDMVAPCRYCGRRVKKKSRSTWQYDHVDPSLYVGAENIVVACTDCNKKKAQRLPAEAGMTLHRPGWEPGQKDWASPPAASTVPSKTDGKGGKSAEHERPAGASASGPVDACTDDFAPFSAVSDRAGNFAAVPEPMEPQAVEDEAPVGAGLVETTLVEERPAGAAASGPVDASTLGIDSLASPAGGRIPRAALNTPRGLVETTRVEERPAGACASGPVDASTQGIDSLAHADDNESGDLRPDLRKSLRQKCGTNEPAAAAGKQVSTRARAGQGRAGQGKALMGKEGFPQGSPPSVSGRKKRRRKKNPIAGSGSVGVAGAVPAVPMGGRFGSPWANWVGMPPVEDDAHCPEHGIDVPCRWCFEEGEG